MELKERVVSSAVARLKSQTLAESVGISSVSHVNFLVFLFFKNKCWPRRHYTVHQLRHYPFLSGIQCLHHAGIVSVIASESKGSMTNSLWCLHMKSFKCKNNTEQLSFHIRVTFCLSDGT